MSVSDERPRPTLLGIFDRAIELSGEERRRFLDLHCAGDALLRRRVESLLAADRAAGDFLQPPNPAARTGMDTGEGSADGIDPLPGTVLGNYRILRGIGSGGMSTVYLAERIGGDFPMTVAIKVIRRGLDTDEVLRRFFHERRLLASLVHENIARLIDGGIAPDGRPYLMMEYVEGEPIDRFCANRSLSLRERLELFRTVCAAVSHAHRSLVVHRDLKPGNILVTRDGDVRLLDFGIAKVLDPDGSAGGPLTATGSRLMTPRYASPEQVRGGPTTTATDVYSLGVVLYELLTGRSPYRMDQTPLALEQEICESAPVRPSTAVRRGGSPAAGDPASSPVDSQKLSRRLHGDLDVIVLKALRKEPERRYGSVEQFSEDIRRHLAGLPVLARPDTFLYRTGKFVRRNVVPVAAGVMVVLLLGVFGVLMARQLAETARERDRANQEAATARQTVEFLEGLFRVPDPNEAQGRTITAREILEHGVTRLGDSFTDRPLVQARLLRTIGGVQTNLGLYEDARGPMERALEIYRRDAGVDSLDLATVLEGLANLRRLGGDTPAALALAEEALAIRERAPGRDDLQLSITLSRVAILRTRQRDFEGARRLLERSLALREAVQGPDHPDSGATLHTLANLYFNMGDLERARAMFGRALALQERSVGPDHPQVASTLSSMAALASDQGRHAAAESLQSRALDIRSRALGPDHDAVGGDLADLALIRKNAGDAAGAREPAERAVAILEASLGSDHPNLGHALLTLAQILESTGERDAARAHAGRAMRIFESRFPPEHPQLQESRRLVGDAGGEPPQRK